MNQYLPELKKSTQGLEIPFVFSCIIAWKLIGVLLKIGYAFLFQEQTVLPKEPLLWDPKVLWLAGAFIPFLNLVAQIFSGFRQTDWGVNLSWDVYPGD